MGRASLLNHMTTLRALLTALCLGAAATAASAQALAVVHTFPGPGPAGGSLIQGADGNFYGTANGGRFSAGVFFSGVLYRMTPAGEMTRLYDFTGGADGAFPGRLMQASDGALYGTTYAGGTYGYGTIFRYTAAGLQTIYSFTRGSGSGFLSRAAPMVQAADGSLYGLSAANNFQREIFRLTADGTVTFLAPVDGLPDVALVRGADGGLYGAACGSPGNRLFRVNADGTVTTVAPFPDCASALIGATDGHLYGSGGNTIFRLTLGGAYTLLHTLAESTEGRIVSALVQGADGRLYGTASESGPHASGTAFRLALDGTFAALHAFELATDGRAPGGLIQAADGHLYGISVLDPPEIFFKRFLVFRMTADGGVTGVRTLDYADEGIKPSALVLASDGLFYGTTEFGGASNLGTVFRMTRAGAITVLHSFTGGGGGGLPEAALVQGSDGSLYGVTHGVSGSGYFPFTYPTAFKVALSGAFTTLHVFGAGLDVSYPRAPLVEGIDGNFYGTTYYGLALNRGSVFRITPAGDRTILHTFAGGADGMNPLGALVQATDGTFYGTTDNGGPSNLGTVFSMTPAGVLTVLHAFAGGTDGSHPHGGLTPAGDGSFYGTTLSGGTHDKGTVYRITPAGTVTIVHAFPGGVGGESPEAPLVHAADGNFYGTTSLGGPLNKGTVFRLTPAGAVSVVRAFSGADGDRPSTALTDAGDGTLYGTTSIGGWGYGVVFRLRVEPAVAGNYDTDRKADLAVFRPATGTWYVLQSANGFTTSIERPWGLPGDFPVPADYDGDGRTDLAVYRDSGAFHPSPSMWYILESSSGFTTSVSHAWGRPGDVPVPGDYDGDGLADLAVYRRTTGVWLIRQSSTGALLSVALGRGNDVAVPADYDGDGKTDPAVYRITAGMWAIRLSSTHFATASRVPLGTPRFDHTLGDLPVPADYDGDGKADVAIYTPNSGTWSIVRSSVGGAPITVEWGLATDSPVPADYDGDGKADPAVLRGSNGTWYVLESASNYTTHSERPWGLSGDLAAANAVVMMTTVAEGAPDSAVANGMRAADLDGDGRAEVTVFRPATGEWLALTSTTAYTSARRFAWGLNGDVTAPGDYDGDGITDVAVYRPGSGVWYILQSSSDFTASLAVQWGLSGDTPAPADFDGDGRTDLAVYRPSSGQWYIRWSSTAYTTSSTYSWGLHGDVPVPGDYDGDGIADLAVYRPANGVWHILASRSEFTTALTYQWGLDGDVAVPGDYDHDGRTDLTVYRPSTGAWYVLRSDGGFTTSRTIFWGLAGDTPAAADYDGDGRTDVAIFRPSTHEWYVLTSTSDFTNYLTLVWGAAGDLQVTGRPGLP